MTRFVWTSPLVTVAAVVVAVGCCTRAEAATCNVPTVTHPDIQAAVNDVGCNPVVVAAGSYQETVLIGRSLTLRGAGSGQTGIHGGVQVQGGTVTVSGFQITGIGNPLWSYGGAEVTGSDIEILSATASDAQIFADGFESGDTSAWTATTP